MFMFKNYIRERIPDLSLGLLTSLIGTIVFYKILGISINEFYYPLGSGDYLNVISIAKNFIDGGNFTSNLKLGFPVGQFMGSYPTLDWLHLIEIWVLSQFISNPFGIFTTFIGYITFKTALISYFLGRFFLNKIFSTIFTFVMVLNPGRIQRVIEHPFISDTSSLFFGVAAIAFSILGFNSLGLNLKYRFVLATLFLFIVSISGLYWALIVLMLTSITILHKLINKTIKSSDLYLLMTYLSLLAWSFYFNTFFEFSKVGSRSFERSVFESELYGGKLASLFLPSPKSGLEFLATLREQFDNLVLTSYEGNSWLPLLGIFGNFAIVSLTLFFRNGKTIQNEKVNFLLTSWFTLVLFYISSGFGLLFSFFLFTEIRAWGRFSLAISIFATLFILVLLNEKWKTTKLKKWFKSILGLLLLGLIFVDLNTSRARIDLESSKILAADVNSFMISLESNLVPNCAMAQLPFIRFPEEPPKVKMRDYDSLWPYLYSENIKFSYGSFKSDDEFHVNFFSNLESSNISQALLSRNGYCGIIIDTFGYEATELEGVINKVDSQSFKFKITSESKRWIAYVI